MKKLLSVLLAVAMFAALLSFGASAQDNKVDQTPRTTVYVSNAGDNNTAEAGNKEKPFKDFLTAYGKLAETGGTVVLLDDVEVDLSAVTAVDSAQRFILPSSAETIYVCGIYREATDDYSALSFINTTTICVELQGDVAFYDMVFKLSQKGSFWYSANGYSLTIGFHVSHELNGGTAEICGGAQSDKVGIDMNPSSGPAIHVYSGTWNRLIAGSFAAVTIDKPCTVNICGGTFKTVTTTRTGKNSASSQAALQAEATINYYGGTAPVIKHIGGKKAAYLNYLKDIDILQIDTTSTPGFTEIKEISVPVPSPDYAVNYCGVQSTDIADGKYSLRFVGTVDSLNFSAVGFEIIARTTENPDGTDYSKSCSTVYTTINAGTYRKYTAAELGGNYIYALAIKNIPVAAGTVSFEITPFVAVGETVYYGTSYTVTCDSGASIS